MSVIKQKQCSAFITFCGPGTCLNLSGRNGSKDRQGNDTGWRGRRGSGVLVDNISLPVTIAMQVCYASLIGLGVLGV